MYPFWLHVWYWLYCMLEQFICTVIWKSWIEPFIQVLCYISEMTCHTKHSRDFISFQVLDHVSAGQATEAAVHSPAQRQSTSPEPSLQPQVWASLLVHLGCLGFDERDQFLVYEEYKAKPCNLDKNKTLVKKSVRSTDAKFLSTYGYSV